MIPLSPREGLYPWALRNFLLPVGDWLRDARLMARLDFLREAQWWPCALVESWRDEALVNLVRTAYQDVPFYRDLFASAGVHWRAIETPSCLRRLPVVTKDMLRAALPGSTVRNTGLPVHAEVSSGSTGAPFRILEDSETASFRRAAFLLTVEWAGWKVGQEHLQTGVVAERDFERRAKDFLLRCHYVSVLGLDDTRLDRALDTISRRRIRHLWGYPSALYHLAERARAVRWNGSPMTSIVTWADQLHPHHRQAIESTFGARVIDTYGCGEGIQVSSQCGHGSHYHVHALDTIVEYLDENDEPAAPGEPARLILTRLLPGATPLIRYEVGDLGVRGPQTPCACGRSWETMESVIGRLTDIITGPSGRRYLAHYFALHLEKFPAIHEYQVEQTGPAELVIRVVSNGPAAPLPVDIRRTLIANGLDDMLIRVEIVSRIAPAATGKRRWIIGLPPARIEAANGTLAVT